MRRQVSSSTWPEIEMKMTYSLSGKNIFASPGEQMKLKTEQNRAKCLASFGKWDLFHLGMATANLQELFLCEVEGSSILTALYYVELTYGLGPWNRYSNSNRYSDSTSCMKYCTHSSLPLNSCHKMNWAHIHAPLFFVKPLPFWYGPFFLKYWR